MKNTTEMTMDELQQAERDYDRAMNEGGEGYNPYRAAREDREEMASRPKTPAERRDCNRDRLQRELRVARYLHRDDQVAALQAELASLDAEQEAEFAAEWTLAVTQERRAQWNTLVRERDIRTAKQVWSLGRELGWTLDDLKKATRMHGLTK